ncbi:ABC transporter permease [Halobacterium zhouii]|uniref:ABC transporter permease n=1 Tax=Halobacterium zhouii TaxID=2902624 RepID=UPI001E5A1A58|nr:ABC transporter permease [Halobacterium zhouii]
MSYMPSTERTDALFTRVRWSEQTGSGLDARLRTVGFVVALTALAAAFAYDYVVEPASLIHHWDVSRMDWLFFLACVLFARYGVVPLAADRERSSSNLRAFLSRPAGVLSLGYVLTFCLLGLLGPEVFGMATTNLYHDLQPPVFTSVNTWGVYGYECLGATSGDLCYGSWQYPLGTTQSGEGMAKMLMYGARIALKLSLAAAMIMVVAATAVGTTAGYFGGWIDDVLMRYVDVQQTIPAIVVYIILGTMFLGKGLFTLALVFGLLDWGGIARLVRSETLKRRSSGYVRAAQAAGASDLHVIRRHVIPNSTATVVTALTRQIPLLILAQIALAYLKLNTVALRSLGGVLRRGLTGRFMTWTQKWWVVVSVTVFLAVTVVAFNVFGDVARDVLDPSEEVA